METVAVISRSSVSLEPIEAALAGHFDVQMSGGDTLVVHGAGSRVYLYVDTDRTRLLMDYSDVGLVKAVVEVVADDPDVVVDNDFGTVLQGNQFVNRIRANKNWDWRRGEE